MFVGSSTRELATRRWPVLKALTDSTQRLQSLRAARTGSEYRSETRQGDSRVFFAVTESGIPTPKCCFLLQKAPVQLTAGLCCTLVLVALMQRSCVVRLQYREGNFSPFADSTGVPGLKFYKREPLWG